MHLTTAQRSTAHSCVRLVRGPPGQPARNPRTSAAPSQSASHHGSQRPAARMHARAGCCVLRRGPAHRHACDWLHLRPPRRRRRWRRAAWGCGSVRGAVDVPLARRRRTSPTSTACANAGTRIGAAILTSERSPTRRSSEPKPSDCSYATGNLCGTRYSVRTLPADL